MNSDLTRVKTFCNWLRVEGLIQNDPGFKVKRLKVRRTAPAAPSSEEVGKLIKIFAGHWLEDYALLLANTGLRPQEALHVRACDLDTERRLLWIRAYQGWEIKDHEDRKLALNDIAFAIVARRKLLTVKGDAVLFPAPKGGGWDYENMTKVWRAKRGETGVAPYDLRHYFATQAVLAAWPLEKLSKYLGHSSVQVTERWYADMRALCEVGAPPIVAEAKQAAQ